MRMSCRHDRRLKRFGISVTAVVAALCAAPAAAQNASREWRGAVDGLTIDLSTGLLNGHGREYVLNPDGSALSMLRWNMRNVVMFNAAVAYRPAEWLKLELRGSTNLTGSSHMDDYDWNLPGCPPSPTGFNCESNHPDTVLRNALLFDAFAAARFLSLGPVQISAVAGYKYDFYRWQSSGGTANYSPLPPGLGISYDQSWRAPYLGLAVEAEHGPWSLRGRLVGSVWALATGRDHHHLRSTYFIDRVGPGQMLSAEIGIGYRLTPAVTVTADYRYQAWRIAQGPTEIIAPFGTALLPGKAAGASNTSHMVSLGIRIRPGESPGPAPVGSGSATTGGFDGFHVGVDVGGAWQNATWTTHSIGVPAGGMFASTAVANLGAGAPRAGVFVGFGRQYGRLIVGLEADLGLANANRTINGIPGALGAPALAFAPDSVRIAGLWDASLRARLGMEVAPGFALYATGGLAATTAHLRVLCLDFVSCVGGADLDESVTKTRIGWTLGAGAEARIAGAWFTRAEYRYSSYGRVTHSFFRNAPLDTFNTSVTLGDHRASIALGYRY